MIIVLTSGPTDKFHIAVIRELNTALIRKSIKRLPLDAVRVIHNSVISMPSNFIKIEIKIKRCGIQ